MVQLFLGTVRIRTTVSKWATLLILRVMVAVLPIRARPWPITNIWRSASVLIVMCVDAGLPVMLSANGTPSSFELMNEKLICQRAGFLTFFLFREDTGLDFFTRVCECAKLAATTLGNIRKRATESLLGPQDWHRIITEFNKTFGNLRLRHRSRGKRARRYHCRAAEPPHRVQVCRMHAQLGGSMRKATDVSAPTLARLAQLGLVLRRVIRNLVCRVRELANIAERALTSLRHSRAHEVPVSQSASLQVNHWPASLRIQVKVEAPLRHRWHLPFLATTQHQIWTELGSETQDVLFGVHGL
mmetsp:Transcript_60547/g.160961  ORF Transcript_60547/g.160961 Transcript_60547/m.160961 type:complete len:300 (+) Transcript_60547:999-1898(+)